MTGYSLIRQLVALSASVVCLAASDLRLVELGHGMRAPHRWVSQVGADAAAQTIATSAIWFVFAWLSMGLLASLLMRLPGAGGMRFGRISESLLPLALRRLLGVSVGMSLALAPTGLANALPSPQVPQHRVPIVAQSPTLPARENPHRTAHDAPHDDTYRVRPGDSLWSIVASQCSDASDERIAELWPAWYEANHRVIGDDPGQLRPGQLLRVPSNDVSEVHR